jgi:hypothetical protein
VQFSREVRFGDILVIVGMIAAVVVFMYRDRAEVTADIAEQIAAVQKQIVDVQVQTTAILAKHDVMIQANTGAIQKHTDQIYDLWQEKADK